MKGRAEAEWLKARVANYWRFHKQATAVAIENNYGECDVLVLTKSLLLIECEIKRTLQDLKHDSVKRKHYRMVSNETDKGYGYSKHKFYFAVPERIKDKSLTVVEESYPYAGLLVVPVDCNYLYPGAHVYEFRKPKLFDNPKPDEKKLYQIMRAMSSNICNMAVRLCKERPLL